MRQPESHPTADPASTNLRSLSAFKKAGFNIVKTVRLADEAFERRVVLGSWMSHRACVDAFGERLSEGGISNPEWAV